jgi:hypothetical protein
VWRYPVRYKFTDVSEETTASIIRIEVYAKTVTNKKQDQLQYFAALSLLVPILQRWRQSVNCYRARRRHIPVIVVLTGKVAIIRLEIKMDTSDLFPINVLISFVISPWKSLSPGQYYTPTPLSAYPLGFSWIHLPRAPPLCVYISLHFIVPRLSG